MTVLNLEDQLVFYRSYHFNTINVLIHSVFVPTILFASFGLGNNYTVANIPLGTWGAIGYSAFYLLLDLKAGLISLPILFGISYKTRQWLVESDFEFNKILIALFLLGWIVQFIGHGVFEKRAPALLTNLVQALVLAPYFVLFEGLFLFGYRSDLKKKVDARVEANIKKFKEGKVSPPPKKRIIDQYILLFIYYST